MRRCIVCSNELVSDSARQHSTQKYCGRECYYNGQFGERSRTVKCTCGKKIIRYPSNPNRKYCSRQCYYEAPKSEEFKQKISKAFKGKGHPNWKGGIMKGRKDRNLRVYKDWRFAVFVRDKFTCVWCGEANRRGLGHSVELEADHIESWTTHPELRYEVDNGRTLCRSCHSTRTAKQHKERMSYAKS